jgi:hypothetical protein
MVVDRTQGDRMIEDGDLGYCGDYHASFVRGRLSPIGAHATAAGEAALAAIKGILGSAKATGAGQGTTPRRIGAPEFHAARARVLGAA